MKMAIVTVEHLSHRYALQWAVRDVSFSIEECGVTGLLGSNGAGKSTIMNVICGSLSPTAGKVTIGGHDIAADPVAAKACIGFLPQRPPLYGDLTVSEYLVFAARLRDMKEKDIPEAVESVLRRCGLTDYSKRLIRNLSGGYQQRVGIAQAIIHNPALVVMDEPTNGLDPNQIMEVRKLITDISKDRAVLISTHILSEVQALCSRIMMIEHGALVFNGTMDEFDSSVRPDSFVISLERAPLEEEMMKVPGVLRVEPLSEYGDRFRIIYDGDRETLSRMAAAAVNGGWGLYGIEVEKSSMNDIFAHLAATGKR